MHSGHYLFTQLTMFLPQRYFRRLVDKYEDRTRNWSFSHWNHLLVLMFGQLIGCSSLRELTYITVAHGKRSYHLGFGKNPVTRNALWKPKLLLAGHGALPSAVGGTLHPIAGLSPHILTPFRAAPTCPLLADLPHESLLMQSSAC